jgi:hypothetical protein
VAVLILSAETRVLELIEMMSVFECSSNSRECRMFLYGTPYLDLGFSHFRTLRPMRDSF